MDDGWAARSAPSSRCRPSFGGKTMKSHIYAWTAFSISVAALARAQPLLNEEHAPLGSFGSLAVGNDRTQMQTFPVDFTGLLTRIDVKVERQPQTVENLVLTVWSTDADELPDRELVTASVPASAVPITSNRVWVSFDVSAADVFVTSGSRLRSEERRVGKECRSRWWMYRGR